MINTRVILVLSSIVAITLGQTSKRVEIHGQVRFAEGGAPAANVVVRLESYEGGGSIGEAFTDSSGKFRFSSLPPAQYSVRVRQSGYRDAQQTIDMTTTSRDAALEKSYEEVKRALVLNPGLAGARYSKGNLLLRVGRTTATKRHKFTMN